MMLKHVGNLFLLVVRAVGFAAGQAAAFERNLKPLEEPGGIVMSRGKTGAQWDYPYGWAPLLLISDSVGPTACL